MDCAVGVVGFAEPLCSKEISENDTLDNIFKMVNIGVTSHCCEWEQASPIYFS